MSGYSNTFNFGSVNNQNFFFVEESFSRLGIVEDLIQPQMVVDATRSANFVLSEWMNKGLNLFTVREGVLGLIYNQNTYQLPQYLNAVLEVALRTTSRPLGGTAFSSAGGIAANAFSGNPALACTQTAPNGYISYNYGSSTTGNQVQIVGFQSNANVQYALVGEYSYDNITWYPSVTFPIQTYPIGQIIWAVPTVPTFAQYYRIRETGGGTLNVQELYFNNNVYDTAMTPISRSEWVYYPEKNQTGRPTQYYFNRQIAPVITIWPVPTSPYNAMYYTWSQLICDFGTLQNTPQISQQFYNAFVDGMSVQLATKYNASVLQERKDAYKLSFDEAAEENRERVPVKIYGDYASGWTQP